MTSKLETRRARAAIDAAEWAAHFRLGDSSRQARQEFVDWLRESPVHVSEMLRVCDLEALLSSFDDWGSIAPMQPQADATVMSFPGPRHRLAEPPSRATAGRLRVAAVAASVLVAGLVGLYLTYTNPIRLHTDSGEQRDETLADGSVIRMHSGTDLRVQLRRGDRLVQLDRGEAVFDVAKDPARPFVVNAGSTRVQAVGTIFLVSRRQDAVVVAVTEGRVAVSPTSARGPSPATLEPIAVRANQRLQVSSRGAIVDVANIPPPPEIRDESGHVSFENARVGDVIRQFNGHNALQLRLHDPALEARIVSGVFAADDPRSFAEFLESVSGAHAVHLSADEILITTDADVRADTHNAR